MMIKEYVTSDKAEKKGPSHVVIWKPQKRLDFVLNIGKKLFKIGVQQVSDMIKFAFKAFILAAGWKGSPSVK